MSEDFAAMTGSSRSRRRIGASAESPPPSPPEPGAPVGDDQLDGRPRDGLGGRSARRQGVVRSRRTEAIAAELASGLRPGDVVLLPRDDLGSGKTTFVRGAARALGVDEPVTSPTFTIGQRYEVPSTWSLISTCIASPGTGLEAEIRAPRRLPDRRRDRLRRVAGAGDTADPRASSGRHAHPRRWRCPRDRDREARVILGFDTTTPETTVAVVHRGEVLFEAAAGPGPDGRPVAGTALLAMVDEAASAAGGWDRIATIAVGRGSFTGLRIAISTARAISQARRIPVAGVDSTAALAAELRRGQGRAARRRDRRCPARQVFAAADLGLGAGEPVVCALRTSHPRFGDGLGFAVAGGDEADAIQDRNRGDRLRGRRRGSCEPALGAADLPAGREDGARRGALSRRRHPQVHETTRRGALA
ncbi:MAG: tRNA (adenosine(37)-N6)-threonylcarbamoyltransferase complex ATPase subunit type 1 TsaE [Solirubrobacterales bacterium]